MPQKNQELWARYNAVLERVRALDSGLAMDVDTAAMNLKTGEVDQARFEALNGAHLSGQLFFDTPTGLDGPEVTVRFTPADSEVPA